MRQRVADFLPQIILAANAGAFAVLLAELIILEHWDGIQRLAPVTAAAGIVLCGAAIVLPARMRIVPGVLLFALSATGLVGFTQHMDERDGGFGSLFSSDDDDDDDNSGRGNSRDRDRDDDEDDDDAEPPPLAPLGLSGTALLSAIAALSAAPARRED